MPITLINPLNEQTPSLAAPAPRLATLAGRTIGLLDISKPGGSFFLDRLEELLTTRYGVARVIRERKPTFTKPAPADVMERLMSVPCHAVVEALAD
jgi:hypothetical protein